MGSAYIVSSNNNVSRFHQISLSRAVRCNRIIQFIWYGLYPYRLSLKWSISLVATIFYQWILGVGQWAIVYNTEGFKDGLSLDFPGEFHSYVYHKLRLRNYWYFIDCWLVNDGCWLQYLWDFIKSMASISMWFYSLSAAISLGSY